MSHVRALRVVVTLAGMLLAVGVRLPLARLRTVTGMLAVTGVRPLASLLAVTSMRPLASLRPVTGVLTVIGMLTLPRMLALTCRCSLGGVHAMSGVHTMSGVHRMPGVRIFSSLLSRRGRFAGGVLARVPSMPRMASRAGDGGVRLLPVSKLRLHILLVTGKCRVVERGRGRSASQRHGWRSRGSQQQCRNQLKTRHGRYSLNTSGQFARVDG